jgi:hypothetical protein
MFLCPLPPDCLGNHHLLLNYLTPYLKGVRKKGINIFVLLVFGEQVFQYTVSFTITSHQVSASRLNLAMPWTPPNCKQEKLLTIKATLQTENTLTLSVHSSVREDYRGSRFL